MTPEHQSRIDRINTLVAEYKATGSEEAAEALLELFHPFILKQCNKWSKIYAGVHPWDHVLHEAQVIFSRLLDEYTIGGDAYFNVFIERILPFRLRYFFIKEIKRRQRWLSHSEEQFLNDGLLGDYDNTAEMLKRMANNELMQSIWAAIQDPEVLTDREREMIILNFVHEYSHDQIAKRFGISRSRVSRIIKRALAKVRLEAIRDGENIDD